MFDNYLTCTPSRFQPATRALPVNKFAGNADDTAITSTSPQTVNNSIPNQYTSFPNKLQPIDTSDITVVLHLCDVLRQFSLARSHPPLASSYYSDLSGLESHLLNVLLPETSRRNTALNMRQKLIQSFYLSALMYIKLSLSTQPTNTASSIQYVQKQTLVRHQHAILELSSEPGVIDFYPPMSTNTSHTTPVTAGIEMTKGRFWITTTRLWFWVMFVGGVTAESILPTASAQFGDTEFVESTEQREEETIRSFYRERLAEMCVQLNLQSWSEAQKFLRMVVWVEGDDELKGIRMWEKIPKV
jgi:hypothetical protein